MRRTRRRAVSDDHVKETQRFSPIIYEDDGEVSQDFEKGMEWAVEAIGEMLGVSANDYSWDAATEEWEGDVRAVMGNMLTAALGEEWGQNPTKEIDALHAADDHA